MITKYKASILMFVSIMLIAIVSTLVSKYKTPNNNQAPRTNDQTDDGQIGEVSVSPLIEKRILNPALVNANTVRFISSLVPEFQDFDFQKNQVVKTYPIKNLINPDRLFWSPDFTKVLIFDSTLTNANQSKILLYDFTTKQEKWLAKNIITANWANNDEIYFYAKENNTNAIYKSSIKGKSNKQKIADVTEPGIITPFPAKAKVVLYVENNNGGMIKIVDGKDPSIVANIAGNYGLPKISPNQTSFMATKETSNVANGFVTYNIETQALVENNLQISPNKIWFSGQPNEVYLAKPIVDVESNIVLSENLMSFNLETKKESGILNNVDGNKFDIDGLLINSNNILYLVSSDFLYKIMLPTKTI